MKILRRYIREFLLRESATIVYKGSPTSRSRATPQFTRTGTVSYDENDENKEKKDELLVEPDSPNESNEADVENEASVATAVAGVTVPMGAGPTYPNKRKKRKSR